jgi:hypothetical protein
MAKQYISSLNLRPRIDGKPVLLEAGKPFDGKLIDGESLKMMLKAGTVKEAEKPAVPEASESKKKVPVQKPQGIWNFKREDMEQLDVLTLNALYKERADENGLEVTAIDDKEELLKVLCSEA